MNNVDDYIAAQPTWQQANLHLFRAAVHAAIPDVEEVTKWNVPVFVVGGKVWFAMSTFKAHTKYNFMHNGALLEDPKKLFNNGLESKKSRGIDLREGESISQSDLLDLIKASLTM